MKWLTLFALFAATSMQAQVLRLAGGDSTVLDTAGASATLFMPNSTTDVGVGLVNGHVQVGASFTTKWRENYFTAGDRAFSFAGGAGLSLEVRGLTVRHEAKHYRWTLFAGATGLLDSTPFITTTNANHFGIGGKYERELGRNWKFRGVALVDGSKRTILPALSYNSTRYVLMGSVGLLQNEWTLNGTAQIKWSHYSATAGHNSYLYSLNGLNYRGNISDVGIFGKWAAGDYKIDAHVSLFAGTSTNGATAYSSVGQTIGAGVRRDWLTVRTDLFRSPYGTSTTTQFAERLSRRWTLREYVTEQAGKPSVNGGFDFTSNFLSLSLGYATYFYPSLPERSPFQQALSVTIGLQLRHSVSVVAQTVQIPNGATKWTAYAGDYLQVGNQASANGPTMIRGGNRGKYEYRGIVQTPDGKPFAGAALQIGKETVFTDSNGEFYLRTGRAKDMPLALLPEQFTAPGDYEAAEPVPATISAVLEAAKSDELIIHVRRKR